MARLTAGVRPSLSLLHVSQDSQFNSPMSVRLTDGDLEALGSPFPGSAVAMGGAPLSTPLNAFTAPAATASASLPDPTLVQDSPAVPLAPSTAAALGEVGRGPGGLTTPPKAGNHFAPADGMADDAGGGGGGSGAVAATAAAAAGAVGASAGLEGLVSPGSASVSDALLRMVSPPKPRKVFNIQDRRCVRGDCPRCTALYRTVYVMHAAPIWMSWWLVARALCVFVARFTNLFCFCQVPRRQLCPLIPLACAVSFCASVVVCRAGLVVNVFSIGRYWLAAVLDWHCRVDLDSVADSLYAHCRAWVKNDPQGLLRTDYAVGCRLLECVPLP